MATLKAIARFALLAVLALLFGILPAVIYVALMLYVGILGAAPAVGLWLWIMYKLDRADGPRMNPLR